MTVGSSLDREQLRVLFRAWCAGDGTLFRAVQPIAPFYELLCELHSSLESTATTEEQIAERESILDARLHALVHAVEGALVRVRLERVEYAHIVKLKKLRAIVMPASWRPERASCDDLRAHVRHAKRLADRPLEEDLPEPLRAFFTELRDAARELAEVARAPKLSRAADTSVSRARTLVDAVEAALDLADPESDAVRSIRATLASVREDVAPARGDSRFRAMGRASLVAAWMLTALGVIFVLLRASDHQLFRGGAWSRVPEVSGLAAQAAGVLAFIGVLAASWRDRAQTLVQRAFARPIVQLVAIVSVVAASAAIYVSAQRRTEWQLHCAGLPANATVLLNGEPRDLCAERETWLGLADRIVVQSLGRTLVEAGPTELPGCGKNSDIHCRTITPWSIALRDAPAVDADRCGTQLEPGRPVPRGVRYALELWNPGEVAGSDLSMRIRLAEEHRDLSLRLDAVTTSSCVPSDDEAGAVERRLSLPQECLAKHPRIVASLVVCGLSFGAQGPPVNPEQIVEFTVYRGDEYVAEIPVFLRR